MSTDLDGQSKFKISYSCIAPISHVRFGRNIILASTESKVSVEQVAKNNAFSFLQTKQSLCS